MQQEQWSQFSPMAPGVFSLDAASGRVVLLGGVCPSCHSLYFPRGRYCRSCLGPQEEISLGSEGTVFSFAVVAVKAPLGLPQPYPVGYIDLDQGGLRVFCLLDPRAVARLQLGQRVRLDAAPLGRDLRGEPCLRPFFTPLGSC